MREQVEALFSCHFISWGEPEDDWGAEVYTATRHGVLYSAPSLALILSAFQEAESDWRLPMAA